MMKFKAPIIQIITIPAYLERIVCDFEKTKFPTKKLVRHQPLFKRCNSIKLPYVERKEYL